jgi:galactokinase
MAWAFRERGLDVPDLNVAITSNIPMGSGVSSSAALEMAIGRAWLGLLDMDMEFRELARCGQRCENGFVGVQSGIMDQLASAGGQAGHALFIDTRSLEVDPVPIPSEWEIVLLDTGKARALTKSAYNERRNSCEFVAKLLGKPSLRDVALQELDSVREIAGENYPRARHVITENERALTFRTALRQGNAVMVGELMRGSHESLREDYEVSCEELDVMASLAWESQSCIGARLTGAGFGGACVALVSAGEGEEFCADILSRYRHQIGDVRGLKPSALLCSASNGANVTLLSDI